jgi:hypothetical protein
MGRVYRPLAYLLAWSVAATITVSVAWLGIRSVLAAAAPTRTVPLSTTQLRRAAPLTTPGASAPGGHSAPAATSPSAIAVPSAGAPSSQPADAGAAPASTVGWQPKGDGFKRSFHTLGGDVDFFTAKDVAQVASSTPKAGYRINVTRYGTDSVMVSFFGDRRTSRVWVRWWNGPYGEITESVE